MGSGTSHHIANWFEIYFSIEQLSAVNVHLPDNEPVGAKNEGKVKLKLKRFQKGRKSTDCMISIKMQYIP